MAFKRDKNIKDFLVRINLRSSDSSGTFPCNHQLRQTYNDIHPATTITNGSRFFSIISKFTGSSSSIIYCISCNKCSIICVCETSRQLNYEVGEHMRNAKHKIHLNDHNENDPDSNISKHFNLPNHSTEDMSILGSFFARTISIKRKTLVKRIIFKLATLYPAGLNKQFNHLQ